MKTRDPDETAARFIDPNASLAQIRKTAANCTACDLYKDATQTVFGEGPSDSPMMLIGEQPGDQEDLRGRPFVGPAGRLLDRALADAGLKREDVYVTNIVKHFKYLVRGKRRIHKKPQAIEMEICSPWLMAEIDRVRPQVVVCLGASAAKALLGSQVRVTRDRGKPIQASLAPQVFVTVHPSSLLRIPDSEARKRGYAQFVADLKAAISEAKTR